MLLEQRRIRGVVKRAQHSGNILQRRAFLAAFPQWPCGLTFEIDNDEVGASKQDLAKMIVAVDARDHRRKFESGEKAESGCRAVVFESENFTGLLADRVRA